MHPVVDERLEDFRQAGRLGVPQGAVTSPGQQPAEPSSCRAEARRHRTGRRRAGHANFAIAEPPRKLVLIEGAPGEETRLDHLGVEVGSAVRSTPPPSDSRTPAWPLRGERHLLFEENDTSCRYALQDKVWLHGPGKESWEVYVVKAGADTLGRAPAPAPAAAPAPPPSRVPSRSRSPV